MSIRTALENHLATITPPIQTAYENVSFAPTANVPYQSVSILYAGITDEAITNDLKRESGIMQVSLFYPTGNGSKSAEDRARLIRSTFTNGLKLTHNGDEVTISKTPDIKVIGNSSYKTDGMVNETNRFVVVVSIFWKSYS